MGVPTGRGRSLQAGSGVLAVEIIVNSYKRKTLTNTTIYSIIEVVLCDKVSDDLC